MITVKQMLVLGLECGLEKVHEAYSQVISHYDAFFSIENFKAEHSKFLHDMFNQGLIEGNPDPSVPGVYKWPDVDETLEAACIRLGYAYTMEYHGPDNFSDPEIVEWISVEDTETGRFTE